MNLHHLQRILEITGIPKTIATLIISWNQALPRRSARHGITWSTPLQEASDYKYSKTNQPLWGFTDYEYWINRKRIEETTRPEIRNYEYYRGVSQGMPTSPLLSTMMLAPYLMNQESIVLYADDGIILSRSPICPPHFPEQTGIELNHDKSHTIREYGQDMRPIKFLGITYRKEESVILTDTKVSGGTLTGTTRNSLKEFKLDKLDLFKEAGYYLNYNGEALETFDCWFNQKIAGYLQSRLYLGSYDSANILQDFAYNYTSQSWADLESRRQDNLRKKDLGYYLNGDEVTELTVFNSSSYANQSLSRWIDKVRPYKNSNCLSIHVSNPSVTSGLKK